MCKYIFPLIVLIAGCASIDIADKQTIEEQGFADFAKFSATILLYIEAKEILPSSLDDIKNFCSEPNVPCPQLDWSKFTLQKVNDEEISAVYKDNDFSLPFVIRKELFKTDAQELLKNMKDKVKNDEHKMKSALQNELRCQ